MQYFGENSLELSHFILHNVGYPPPFSKTPSSLLQKETYRAKNAAIFIAPWLARDGSQSGTAGINGLTGLSPLTVKIKKILLKT